jgi:ectoine hydroxylase-related dioxygenase (phytanoyl-CoA dioxygenase family)
MAGLSADQLAAYLDDGFLLLEDALSPVDLQPLIDDITAEIDRKTREALSDGKLSDPFEGAPFDRRLTRISDATDDPSEIEREVTGKRLKTAGMFSLITCPAILDIVESVIGPEILAHPQFNCQAKMPNEARSQIPWHQDLGFLHPEAEATFMVNFWIPLVDATVENGCMEVIAGSHRAGLIEHVRVRNYWGIAEDRLPPGEQVACPIRVGGVLLVQHKTIHRSIPNHSDHVRWSLDLRYSDSGMPTGRDVPGFIARSRANPASVAKSHLDWLRLVEEAEQAS